LQPELIDFASPVLSTGAMPPGGSAAFHGGVLAGVLRRINYRGSVKEKTQEVC
jgi:hypothetical protein